MSVNQYTVTFLLMSLASSEPLNWKAQSFVIRVPFKMQIPHQNQPFISKSKTDFCNRQDKRNLVKPFTDLCYGNTFEWSLLRWVYNTYTRFFQMASMTLSDKVSQLPRATNSVNTFLLILLTQLLFWSYWI